MRLLQKSVDKRSLIARSMRSKRIHVTIAIGISGFFLLLDQAFKYAARLFEGEALYIIRPWLGWEFLANTGIAFGLPIPNGILIVATPIILFGLLLVLIRKKNFSVFFLYGALCIVAGAISNYIDRILFLATIDYLRIVTSVINIGDVLIVTGALLLLADEGKTAQKHLDAIRRNMP